MRELKQYLICSKGGQVVVLSRQFMIELKQKSFDQTNANYEFVAYEFVVS